MRVKGFLSVLFICVSLGIGADVLIEGSGDAEILNVVNRNVPGTGITVRMADTTGANYTSSTGLMIEVTGTSQIGQGIYSYAAGTHEEGSNIGVLGMAYGSGDSWNYGLFGGAGGGAYSVGVYGGSSYGGLAGLFEGDVVVTGYCDCYPSDLKFKQNIRSLGAGLDKIMALQPKAYEMRTDEFKNDITLAKGPQFGLIAQDVKALLPELVHQVKIPARLSNDEIKKNVKKDPITYESMNYTGLIPVLIKAMQEQQAQIEALKAKVASLEK